MGKVYGYARVSTIEQNLDRQIIALKEKGVPEENIFFEKESGKNFNRPVYKKMVDTLQEGDKLIINSLDRLGRNYKEIRKQWNYLTGEKKIMIQILDFSLLNTFDDNDTMQLFLMDNILNVSAYMAEMERTNILSRQKAGIAAARLRGVQFGRPKKEMPDNFLDVYKKWKNNEISARKAGKECGISANTFLARARELKNAEEKHTDEIDQNGVLFFTSHSHKKVYHIVFIFHMIFVILGIFRSISAIEKTI